MDPTWKLVKILRRDSNQGEVNKEWGNPSMRNLFD